MGDLNTECPNCGCEDAYFNGTTFDCPNCDYEWESDNFELEDDDE